MAKKVAKKKVIKKTASKDPSHPPKPSQAEINAAASKYADLYQKRVDERDKQVLDSFFKLPENLREAVIDRLISNQVNSWFDDVCNMNIPIRTKEEDDLADTFDLDIDELEHSPWSYDEDDIELLKLLQDAEANKAIDDMLSEEKNDE